MSKTIKKKTGIFRRIGSRLRTIFTRKTKTKDVLNLGEDLNAETDTDEKYYTPLSSARKLKIEHITKICSDSGVCLAFGPHSEVIKNMFDFTSFEHIDSEEYHPIKRIGEESKNGFINQIAYSIKIEGLFGEPDYDYKAYAVLKSAQLYAADNLMYEFLVGEFINKQNLRFPCFLETYGLFKYQNVETWNQLHNSSNNKNILKPDNIKQLLWNDYATACKHSKYLALLIQHLKGIESVWSKFTDPIFVSQELLYILFQVYIPLSLIKDNFTHYDLHSMNVCLYTPVIGKYIEYHYHLGKKEVVFKSQYIAKIIDYGRSYFKDDTTKTNSKQIYDAVCNEPKCNENPNKCGYDNGFSWLYNPQNEIERKANFYICSQKRSMSHDLRFLNDVLTYTQPVLRPYMMPIKYKIDYGTPELIGSGLSKNIINNVQDAANHFIREVTKPDAIMANEAFYRSQGFTSLGELHIYDDGRPMRYVKA